MSRQKSMLIWGGIALALTSFVAYVAYRTRPVPTPRRRWKRFESPDTVPLDAAACLELQGIYTIEEGNELFGDNAILKCSYTVENNKTVYHLSLFCEKDGTFMITEARKQGNVVLLNGHWRRAAANGAGVVQLMIVNRGKGTPEKDIIISGAFGEKTKKPRQPVLLRYQQSIPKKRPLDIIAHRGGARNVDFLPMSENTTEMIKMAPRLGATGVEIDVRMTKDKVPVIFHDSFLSIHTVKRKVYGGLVHNYLLKDLQKIELRKGGYIPTLQECLHTILYETPLETVWLDIKKECDLEKIHKLQEQYMERAATIGRTLNIYIGIPDKAVLKCFQKLEDFRSIPSLTEMDTDVAREVNAQVWAPQYTNGTEKDNIEKMHAQGRKAFVWSLDRQFMMDLYLTDGGYDGLVTNTPSVVVHWHYTSELKTAQEEAAKAAV